MAENPPVFGSFGARKGRQKAVCPWRSVTCRFCRIFDSAGSGNVCVLRTAPAAFTVYGAFQQCKGFGFGNENISESCCNYIKCGHQENQSLDAHILSLQKKIQRFESELDDILLYRGTMQPP